MLKTIIENVGSLADVLIKLLNHFKENWKTWIQFTFYVVVILFITIISIMFTRGSFFERYNVYQSEQHMQSTEYRMLSTPQIIACLDHLVLETGADRAYVFEYHNGKNNPSGLQWQYADMTFTDSNCDDIADEYQNLPLNRYVFPFKLYSDGLFIGTTEELSIIDKRLALRIESNNVCQIATQMIYAENNAELGFIGISFTDKCLLDEKTLKTILNKYCMKITPLLDNANCQKIKHNHIKS